MPRKTLALVLGGLLTGLLLGFMDVTIVTTAGPTVVSDLGGLSLYAWVFSSFLIVQTVVIPIFGKLSDLYGRKRFFLLGLSLFMVGSVLSGASQNIYELILFRGVQGIGFGAFLPTSIAITGDMFPPEKRGRAQGLLFSVNGIAFAVAPAAGSYLTEVVNWRWIFYINLPLGVLSFMLIYFAMHESRRAGAATFSDWPGAASLSAALAVFMTGLSLGGSTFPWASWQEVTVLSMSAVAALAFIWVERRALDPVLPLSLFKIRTIAAGTAVNLTRVAVLFGVIVYLPFYSQAVLGGSVSDVRNVVYSIALPFTLGNLLAGASVSRLGPRRTILIGAAILTAGMVALRSVDSSSSILQLMELSVPLGLGSGMLIPPIISAFQNSVQQREIGVATSLVAFMVNMGGAIGLTILGAIQANTFSSQLSSILSRYQANAGSAPDPNTVGQILASPQTLARLLAANPSFGALIPLLREALSQSILALFPILLAASIGVFASGILMGKRSRKVVVRPVE